MFPHRGVLVVGFLVACGSACHAQLLLGAGRAGCPKPKALSAAATSDTAVSLTWQAGDGGSPATCGGYLIAIFKDGQPAGSGKSFASSVPAAIISGLSRGATYTVQVRALSRLGLAASEPAQLTGVATSVPSPAASSAAAGASGSAAEDAWACVAAQGYPVCAAGSAGLCTPITCAEMARLGRCAAPYIRVQDWQRRTLTQHCAAECGGCAGRAVPRLADSMAPPQAYCCAFNTGAYFAGPGGAAVAAK
ncbi:hypothetical protein CHLNCDRAFT_132994 [Chlorella variabilis]|uniref:Fibronectin type-III domain-containing protein n=1 Tax=Chlorella variabilis TaxID=554065 RepID=E1Z241_CHLVA|nr:hypothetical protein CHLNCDRAFT_132994 [Chlorella variabilis]EFN59929.1 hypothetical protein CHLNCDRAFT_132994 [Chlorella variabilis]|eukprot:XP_005852031.1 hypothetical protein CHLNCDRAFT_132994 [Chlorella variabilis]